QHLARAGLCLVVIAGIAAEDALARGRLADAAGVVGPLDLEAADAAADVVLLVDVIDAGAAFLVEQGNGEYVLAGTQRQAESAHAGNVQALPVESHHHA